MGMSQVASQIDVSKKIQVPQHQGMRTPKKDFANTPNFNAFAVANDRQYAEPSQIDSSQNFLSNNNTIDKR
jgi:hypothetical protein